MTSDQRSEVIRSPWGQNEKILVFLNSLTQNKPTFHHNIKHAKLMNSKYLPLIRGQSSFDDLLEVKMKKKSYFWISWPKKKLYFNIHHAKLVNSKFWPLNRGQRSIKLMMASSILLIHKCSKLPKNIKYTILKQIS